MNWDRIVQSMQRLGRLQRVPDGFAAKTRTLLEDPRPEGNDTPMTTNAVASVSAIPGATSARDTTPESPPER